MNITGILLNHRTAGAGFFLSPRKTHFALPLSCLGTEVRGCLSVTFGGSGAPFSVSRLPRFLNGESKNEKLQSNVLPISIVWVFMAAGGGGRENIMRRQNVLSNTIAC